MVAMALIVVALATEPPAKPSVSAMARPYSAAVNMHQDSRPMGEPPVAIAIEISAAGETLWTGNLRVGGSGGSSFSESRSEFEEPCPGRPEAADRYYSSNHQLSFNINRQISPENPDQFWVNVSWGRPAPRCEGNGTNTVGFNRLVTLPAGQTVQIGGEMGLLVKLTRQR